MTPRQAQLSVRLTMLILVLTAAVFYLRLPHSWNRFFAAAQNQTRTLATVSAASFELGAPVAPESIAAIFGVDLAREVSIVSTLPLPTELLGTSVGVRDSAGIERLAFLFFISPGQINCLIPAGTAEGTATITVRSGKGNTETGTVLVRRAAPGILTANASGTGAPAAVALRIRGNSFGFEPILKGAYPNIVPAAIDLGPEGESVFLVLYLCGLRFVPKADVRVLLGGSDVPPEDFAYSPSDFIGVDQLNVRLSRTLIGRGRLKLSVVAQGRVSNQIEFEIGGRIVSAAPQITAISKTTDVLAGEEITLTGAQFAATAKDNVVRLGTRPATVTSASPGQLRVRVPYGAEGGAITVVTPQGEGRSSEPLKIRTTISGFVRDTHNAPIPGVKVTMDNTTVQTNSEGLFFINQANAGNVVLQFDGRAVTGALFPDPPIRYRILPNRDNLVETPVFLLQVNGAQTQIGPALTGSSETQQDITLTTAAPDQTGVGELKFSVPAGTTIRFPNGATSGTLTLNAEPNGLTPIALPPDNFVSVIAQLAFFGATLNPGGKLIFPNPEQLPPGTVARLYQYDVAVGSPTRGEWVDIKDTVTVFADRIETSANAIKQSTYYFIAAERPVTTAIGRVIENNGTPEGRPVAGASVRIRGREIVTDGNGGFVLRNVGVNGDGRIFADVNLLRSNGQVDSKQSAGVQAVLNGVTNLGTIVLATDAIPNRPPTALIPPSILVTAGRSFDQPFTASDPDPGQTITLQVSDTRLAAIIARGGDAYTLRVNPALSDANTTIKLTLTVTDNLGAAQNFDISVIVRGGLLAISQLVITDEDTPIAIRLSGNDPAGQPLTYQIISQTDHGKLSGTAPDLIYTPDVNYNSSDNFTFKVNNGVVDSNVATVSITIRPINDQPVLTVPGVQTVNEGQLINFTLTASDPDIGQTLTFSSNNLPTGANLSTIGRFTWTPDFTQAGTYDVTFAVIDNGSPALSDSKTMRITVNNVNRAPAANNQFVMTNEDTSVSITLIGNDPDGDAVSFIIVGNPSNGTLSGSGADRLYTPKQDFSGTDSFTFKVTDGALDSKVATLTITIISVNDAPILTVASPQNVGAGGTLSFTIFASDGDIGQVLTLSASNLPSGATFTQTSANIGQFNWTPSAAQVGSHTVTFKASDNGMPPLMDSKVVIINVTAPPPRWTQTGGPTGGMITAIVIKGSSIFAGTRGGGIFRSTNNGQSWTQVGNGLTNKYVEDLLISGTNLFAGTISGVFVSTDDGLTWTPINNGLQEQVVRALAVSGNNIFAGTGSGIFVSANNGQSWTAMNNGLTTYFVESLTVSGTNIFAGMSNGGGVFVSGNNGQSWAAASNGLQGQSVLSLIVSGNNIFAGATGGVYVSTNSGQSWTQVNSGLTTRFVTNLAISGTSIFAGTYGGVFVSTNNGQSWSTINSGLTNPVVTALAASSATLFTGTYDGMFISTLNGQNRVLANDGLRAWSITALAVDGTRLFAGAEIGGLSGTWAGSLFVSDNDGQIWTAANTGRGPNELDVRQLVVNGSAIFAVCGCNGVFTSTDKGQSWTAVNNGLSATNRCMYSLIASGTRLFAGNSWGQVYVSTDNGQNWTEISNGLPNDVIFSLAVSGTNLLAVVANNGVFVSTNNGQSWTAANTGLTASATTLAVNGTNILAGTFDGVFVSTNGGQSWSMVSNGFPPYTYVSTLHIDGKNIFAGTIGYGVFVSANNGQSWTSLKEGLTNLQVKSLMVKGTNLFAGTVGSGVFVLDLSGLP